MKYILFLFIIITLSLPAIAKENTDIEIIENNGQIFSYNKKTQEKIKLVNGHKPLVSHDRTKFVYLIDNKEGYDPIENYSNKLYIYDIPTHTTRLIFNGEDNDLYVQQYWFNDWSTDDKYLIIEEDKMMPAYTYFILEVSTGKIISKFFTDNYSWLNTTEILSSDFESDIKPVRSSTTGTPRGLAIINIETGIKKIIKHATPTEDYHFSINNDNQILVEKYVYKLEKTHKIYISGIDHVTTYIMDRNTFELREIKTEIIEK